MLLPAGARSEHRSPVRGVSANRQATDSGLGPGADGQSFKARPCSSFSSSVGQGAAGRSCQAPAVTVHQQPSHPVWFPRVSCPVPTYRAPRWAVAVSGVMFPHGHCQVPKCQGFSQLICTSQFQEVFGGFVCILSLSVPWDFLPDSRVVGEENFVSSFLTCGPCIHLPHRDAERRRPCPVPISAGEPPARALTAVGVG